MPGLWAEIKRLLCFGGEGEGEEESASLLGGSWPPEYGKSLLLTLNPLIREDGSGDLLVRMALTRAFTDGLLALPDEEQEEFPPAICEDAITSHPMPSKLTKSFVEGPPPPQYEAPLAPAPPGLELLDEELEEDALAWEQRG
ncbi:hypothetical protein LTR37_003226 [Vermiconidia calcicola]|uniref:Uncharacterized protein n=1 Tax=Vermiconidia calcicola TaxID=1690605 RepID=A0ACC3NRH7_9PEZI|nr:hypothetical protein LTR37_003226 [Vermiconidia calcicola]